MAMIKCPECGNKYSNLAPACPNCAAPTPTDTESATQQAEESQGGSVWPWVIGVPVALVVAFLVFGAAVGNTPEGKARAAARQTIEMCWQDQGKKSLDPNTGRFVASVCESMEAEFRRAHGYKP